MPNTASTLSQRYYDFANVTFPSMVDDGAYRVCVKTNEPPTNAVIWLESKKTKLQWQCVIEDFTKHMKSAFALPNAVILAAIKNGLAAIDEAASKVGDAATMPSVVPASTINLCAEKTSLALRLEIKMSPEWTTGYSFEMTPIEVKVVDILEARIRDLEAIVARPRLVFCTVTGTVAGVNLPCTWTTPDVKKASALIRLDDNAESVVLLQQGVYTIQCACQSVATTSASISLYIGATCVKTSSYTTQYNSSQMLDIAHVADLDAGTHLQLLGGIAYGVGVSMTVILHV
ncbi:hypothetical protein SDRG_14080 [Saprolegnia diclina VS20]|uniref:Uncharacterized protein n=1 Tax=Saprolegnia diclina (strain VS20) TaxID=1156394 RepID=T0Q3X0_SAPDV|nr:hypothetical protein SDRG_14080 [Saprolegnia diclina VS20]EQC28120.1 hypothetical protein SDRG_14080 [Saprolegnia diclina VS20]|eukprot:XP_008618406.1 hypothetical protein SDRG_14080 [Saprolegnia diclina VS20]